MCSVLSLVLGGGFIYIWYFGHYFFGDDAIRAAHDVRMSVSGDEKDRKQNCVEAVRIDPAISRYGWQLILKIRMQSIN